MRRRKDQIISQINRIKRKSKTTRKDERKAENLFAPSASSRLKPLLLRQNMSRTKTVVFALAWLPALWVWRQSQATSPSPSSSGDTTPAVRAEAVKQIAGKLMAPCCWSQTADVHTSDTAKEMQAQIRAALQQGYGEDQILDAFVAGYGERILAEPRASGFNLLVWILPGMALAAGGTIYWRYVQRARAKPELKPKRATSADETYSQRFERELAEYE